MPMICIHRPLGGAFSTLSLPKGCALVSWLCPGTLLLLTVHYCNQSNQMPGYVPGGGGVTPGIDSCIIFIKFQ